MDNHAQELRKMEELKTFAEKQMGRLKKEMTKMLNQMTGMQRDVAEMADVLDQIQANGPKFEDQIGTMAETMRLWLREEEEPQKLQRSESGQSLIVDVKGEVCGVKRGVEKRANVLEANNKQPDNRAKKPEEIDLTRDHEVTVKVETNCGLTVTSSDDEEKELKKKEKKRRKKEIERKKEEEKRQRREAQKREEEDVERRQEALQKQIQELEIEKKRFREGREKGGEKAKVVADKKPTDAEAACSSKSMAEGQTDQ